VYVVLAAGWLWAVDIIWPAMLKVLIAPDPKEI
jgi:hypothetical protein